MENNIGIVFIFLALLSFAGAVFVVIINIFNFFMEMMNEAKPKGKPNNKKYVSVIILLLGYAIFYTIGFVLIN
ncbi:hypothetical protein ERX35_002855 [Macrococcus equipercicus]|uniref:Mid2-like cell wall stress sensor domain protein n=1 Tax=Macrococcus equipercicus TaxID=69967 RepID=A0ABQ6R9F8_9STAP|nr:hypothetical protein [Macrococcus equipercicus]KAA1039944.1 hypothetical protein ERX35_002855 [Macrococcus equipercicus]